MKPMMRISPLAGAICLLLLTACGPLHKPSDVVFDAATIPPSGVYALQNVVITDRSNDQYRLVAGATNAYTSQQLMAILWCRADALAREKRFENWKPLKLSDSATGNVHVSVALIELQHTPPTSTKDWCLEIPPAASIAAPTVAPIAPAGVPIIAPVPAPAPLITPTPSIH